MILTKWPKLKKSTRTNQTHKDRDSEVSLRFYLIFFGFMNNDKFDVSEPWESTNQDWWDWYVTLAHNDENLKQRFSYRLPKVLTEAAAGALPIKEIHSEYSVSDAEVTKFREEGFIKLRNVPHLLVISCINSVFSNSKSINIFYTMYRAS